MKPLNRPMFRYGGPIKEGVMSGIREPKKDGGLSKQFNTGLVGDERYPKTDGREHHFAFIPPLVAAANVAARILPAAYRGYKASRYLNPNAATTGQKIKNFFLPRSSQSLESGGSKYKNLSEYASKVKPGEGFGYKIGSFAKTNPVSTFGIASAVPQVGYGAYNLAKAGIKGAPDLAKNYIDMVLPGEQFRDPDAITTGKNNIQDTNRDDRKKIVSTDASKKGGGAEMSAEELRKKNVERYRDIMDIKGMNKDAAYNSLIAASQAINESGDFKGDIKSGKLINQIIQATSKQFDKPKATKDAIDTLILKGEIEKDIKASDPNTKLDADYKRAKIAESQKSLNPTYNTLVAINTKAGAKGQAVFDGAAKDFSDNRGETFRGNLISKSDFKDILSTLKKDPKTQNADDVTIIATWTQGELDSSQKNIPDGNYTVGDRVVTIKDKIVVDVN